MNRPLLEFTAKGIYCSAANVYLDPWKPVTRALITHGHSDHARSGHTSYLTHEDNVPILYHRLGPIQAECIPYDKSISINGVRFSFHPAGHVPGSSQIRVEYKGEIWVFSGDYKLENDGLSIPFDPIRCHTFITECTFGLPAFSWRAQSEVIADIHDWWRSNREEGKTSVLFAYTLGKAQRLLMHLDQSIGKVYTHGAVEKMTEAMRSWLDMPPTQLITRETDKAEVRGNLILAPPSAHGTPWLRRFAPYETGTASGWMAFRGARRRRAIDRGFVLSDHADWPGLLMAVKETGCEKVIATHGYSDIFARYLREQGYDARTAQTQYSGELVED